MYIDIDQQDIAYFTDPEDPEEPVQIYVLASAEIKLRLVAAMRADRLVSVRGCSADSGVTETSAESASRDLTRQRMLRRSGIGSGLIDPLGCFVQCMPEYYDCLNSPLSQGTCEMLLRACQELRCLGPRSPFPGEVLER